MTERTTGSGMLAPHLSCAAINSNIPWGCGTFGGSQPPPGFEPPSVKLPSVVGGPQAQPLWLPWGGGGGQVVKAHFSAPHGLAPMTKAPNGGGMGGGGGPGPPRACLKMIATTHWSF